MNDNILVSEFIEIIKKNAIGRSISYPCGWIKTDTITKIVDMIENGEIDKFGKSTRQNEIIL